MQGIKLFPNRGGHRASLCLTRLTNHPDIPKQQLPAITSSRTHVPISRTPISSSALDRGQISAPGCSRARLLPSRSRDGKEHPRARRAPLPCRRDGSSLDACNGGRSLPGRNPGEQQRLLPSCASCQATQKKNKNILIPYWLKAALGRPHHQWVTGRDRAGQTSFAGSSYASLHPAFSGGLFPPHSSS